MKLTKKQRQDPVFLEELARRRAERRRYKERWRAIHATERVMVGGSGLTPIPAIPLSKVFFEDSLKRLAAADQRRMVMYLSPQEHADMLGMSAHQIITDDPLKEQLDAEAKKKEEEALLFAAAMSAARSST